MSEVRRTSLPQGAKGIDLGDGVLMFAKDKIVLSAKGKPEHITVHFGPHSGVVDVHKTTSAADGSRTHQRLYSIPHGNLAALFEEFAPTGFKFLTRVVRPLDLDTLIRRHLSVVVGLLTTGPELEAVTGVRHQKLVVDAKKLAARARAPEFLEELYDLKDDEFFTVFSVQKRRAPRIVGHGFPLTDSRGDRHLFWVQTRQLSAETSRMTVLLRDLAVRHGKIEQKHDTTVSTGQVSANLPRKRARRKYRRDR